MFIKPQIFFEIKNFLMEIILRMFIKIERYMKRNIPSQFIGYKKSETKRYVFFVSPTKIKESF